LKTASYNNECTITTSGASKIKHQPRNTIAAAAAAAN
jgi:hypothetical protein